MNKLYFVLSLTLAFLVIAPVSSFAGEKEGTTFYKKKKKKKTKKVNTRRKSKNQSSGCSKILFWVY